MFKKMMILPLMMFTHSTLHASEPVKVEEDPSLFESLGKKIDDATHSFGEQLDEAGVTARIFGKYSIDSKLGPFKIQIFTNDGNVKLVGDLQTGEQFERAVMLAASTESVRHVDAARLVIKDTTANSADLYLTALIKAEIIKNRLFDKNEPNTWPVSVAANNNVITLKGKLSSPGKKQQLIEISESFDGISKIEDFITIEKN